MVVAAALAQSPVTVDYTYRGATDGLAWQKGAEVFASPTLLRKWDWKVELGDTTAEINAEGREFRLPIEWIEGRKTVSLTEALRYVGGEAVLKNERYRVLSQVRLLESVGESTTISSTLAVEPRAFRVPAPDRLVIDLHGAVLTESAIRTMPDGWRAAQHKPDIVRLVYEGEGVARIPVPKLSAGRSCTVSLVPVEPPKETKPADPNEIPLAAPDSIPGKFGPRIDPPKLISASESEATFALPFTGSIASEPRARYVDPLTIEIEIKGASPSSVRGESFGQNSVVSDHVLRETSTGTTILIRTRRPTIFQIAKRGSMLELTLTLPGSADGKLGGKVVIVDAGHGGKDSGATYQGLVEKELTLTIAKALAEELTRQGAAVIMTRKDDRFVELRERADVANDAEADFFISVHINSHPRRGSVSGGMTFHHLSSKTGKLLAECIQAEIAKVNDLPDLGAVSDGTIYNVGFAVLRWTEMPGVLLELGFIDHARDRKRIVDKEFQKSVSQAVARGLKVFLGMKADD